MRRIFPLLLLLVVACSNDPVEETPNTDPLPDEQPDNKPTDEAPIEGYTKIWGDEFDGDTLNTMYWTAENTVGANQEAQYYSDRAENIRLEDGCLLIEAHKEQLGGREYTSARINSRGKIQFKYGYIETRMMLPRGRGTWPAFWMLGTQSVWPACGEIDIMEHSGQNPAEVSHALHTLERNTSNGKYWSTAYTPEGGVEGVWHTYALLWEEAIDNGDDRITFMVDGVSTAVQYQPHGIEDSARWPFNSYFYVVINLAMGGLMGGVIDDAIFDEGVVMKVDYVRLYQKQ